MGSFSINNNTAGGTYNISGSNGAQSGNTAQLSVGAPFTIAASWSFGGCLANITQIVISIDSNDFLVKKDNCAVNLTSYVLQKGQYHNTSTYTWTPCFGTQTTASIDLYAGKTSATQTITVHGYYSFGTGTFDESVTFTVQVDKPTCPLTFNPPTGSNVFQFGPFLNYKGIPLTFYWTPVSIPWRNDGNYLNPPAGWNYRFGSKCGGTNAWNFYGSVTNSTHSDGNSYCMQLVRYLEPPEVTYAKTNWNFHVYLKSTEYAYDHYERWLEMPKDQLGQTDWGVDCYNAPPGSQFPWAYSSAMYTRATAGSGLMAVPPASSIPDANNVPQSYYADNPGSNWPNTDECVVEINLNYQFITYIVWNADGGVPIGLAAVNWALDSNEYNAKADMTGNYVDSTQTETNWDLTKTFQTPGSVVNNQYYIDWGYRFDDYNKPVNPPTVIARPVKAASGGPNLAPMGSGPMGGAVTVPNFGNAALTPRGSSVGYAGMNGA